MIFQNCSKINRIRTREIYDQDTVYIIIDELVCCYVSFLQYNQPFIIPTFHTRINDQMDFTVQKLFGY